MKDVAGGGAKTVLDLLKTTEKILYPELLAASTPSLAALKAGRDDDAAEPLSLEDFPLLQALRESFNFLWGRLILKDRALKKHLAFYGCSRQVGTTFLSFHLALFAALSQGVKTLYVDTDCDRSPETGHPVGNTALPGLLSVFFEGAGVEDCLYRTRVPNLFVLPAGRPVPGHQPNQFPPTDIIAALADCVRGQFDVVVYDCRSVLIRPVAISYGRLVDAVILVCRYAVSRREVCKQVIETFKRNGLDIAGVVLNEREYPIPKNIYDMLK